ncbi:hypothetical protein CRYUN_Cryun04dG0156100 [Craigia yunnanensis]
MEARVNCLLRGILKQIRWRVTEHVKITEAAGAVLLVKVNFFECGDMAIRISISHKIADLSTLSIFIKSRPAMAQGFSEELYVSSLSPPTDLLFTVFGMKFKGQKFASRRFLLDASKNSMLKAQAASTDVLQLMCVEAVTALIWKCAKAASTLNRGGFKETSALLQAVNFRKRMKPPLPENFIGNLIYGFITRRRQIVKQNCRA